MTSEVILLSLGDPKRAQQIFESFAERTGLVIEPIAGGVRCLLSGVDREVKVLETLTDIDVTWAHHVSIRQPRPHKGGSDHEMDQEAENQTCR